MRRMRGEDAVRGVSAVHIKVAILKATFSLVEHIKRLRLVLLDGGNSLVEHGLGFLCSTVLGYLRWVSYAWPLTPQFQGSNGTTKMGADRNRRLFGSEQEDSSDSAAMPSQARMI